MKWEDEFLDLIRYEMHSGVPYNPGKDMEKDFPSVIWIV